MKAVELLVEDALPMEMRGGKLQLDSRGLGDLLARLAREFPDKYEAVSKRLSDIGRKATWYQGETLTLDDMRPVIDREAIFKEMDARIDEARKKSKTEEEFERQRENIWLETSGKIKDMTADAALKAGNNLAYSVVSGARGKAPQLQSMLSTPGVYTDANDRVIPLFIRHSYGEGLRPAEYLASTYGARKSVISTKVATARGGDFSKQLGQSAAPLVVTEKDCGVRNGLDLDPESEDLRGRLLARPTAGIPAGTLIDRHVMARLRKSKAKKVVARSPMTCQAKQGVCSKCMGLDAEGNFPAIGDHVGETAANSIGEPITQSALNVKHQSGQGSAKREYSGFDVIDRFAQSPENFPDRAAVAPEEGTVTSVKEAPQGGYYITVNEKEIYVPHGYPVTVKAGDEVEAGDQLSEGLVDPGDIVNLRGLGSGRRYYRDRLMRILADSGMPADPRHVETVTRANISHVKIDDPDDENLPDDIADYNYLQARYVPEKDTRLTALDKAKGKYLQEPALHYTVGTRLTPKMVSRLKESGWGDVAVSEKAPNFSPEMVRLRASSHYNPDWMAALNTSYLKRQIHDNAIRGRDTDTMENVHYAPRLARGKDFGVKVRETGKF